MDTSKDPMGRAILEYQNTRKSARLRVLSSLFEEDEMPVEHLFRTYAQMSRIERKALELAKGRILDVGAGAGCHSYALQQEGKEVTSLDISPLSCQAMSKRGIMNVVCKDLFSEEFSGSYDTILLLMNGTGIAGTLDRLPLLFEKLKKLIAPGGAILIDSSDLKYLYEDEEGNLELPYDDKYYGEIDYQMIYRDTVGESFDWLYVDYPTLHACSISCGLQCELLLEGEHFDYLARLSL